MKKINFNGSEMEYLENLLNTLLNDENDMLLLSLKNWVVEITFNKQQETFRLRFKHSKSNNIDDTLSRLVVTDFLNYMRFLTRDKYDID